MRRGLRLAIGLLIPALPLCLGLIFVPDELQRARDVLAWRERTSAWQYLDERRRGLYREAAWAEIDAQARATGLVSRLIPPPQTGRMPPVAGQVLTAALHPTRNEVLTASGTIAVRWDLTSGGRVEEIGPARRRDLADAREYGFGFGEAVWADQGQTVAGLTGNPHALWLLRDGVVQERIRLDGHGHEQLSTRDTRLAWLRGLEHGVVLQRPGAALLTLPHDEVTAITLADESRAVTASRRSIQWWQGGTKGRTQPIDAQGNPVAFSSDARWALAPVHRSLELWSTEDGSHRRIDHEAEVRAVCATAEYLATGTDDGHVQLWSADDWQLRRRFRASVGPIERLQCGEDLLLVTAEQFTVTRVWDVAGRAQNAPVPEPRLPRLSWLVQHAADEDWPRRHPRLVALLEDSADGPLRWIALAVLVALAVVVQLLGRRR